MKLTDENADYMDCRPVVHRRHSPQMDAFEKKIAEQAKAERASRAKIKGTSKALKNPIGDAED